MSEEQSGPLPKSPHERIDLVATVTSLHHENKRLREERDTWETRTGDLLREKAELRDRIAKLEAAVKTAQHVIDSYLDVENLTTQAIYRDWKATLRDLEGDIVDPDEPDGFPGKRRSSMVPIKPSEMFQIPQWWRLRIIEREAEIERLQRSEQTACDYAEELERRIAKLEEENRILAERNTTVDYQDIARKLGKAMPEIERLLEREEFGDLGGGDDE